MTSCSISRDVFIKCTKSQDRTPMRSVLLKIARFVVMKAILTALRHFMTSWRHFDVTRPCSIDFSWSFYKVYQVSRSNAYGKFTFKNSLFCPGEGKFDNVTSLWLWRHDVILTSRDHVHLISREVFNKCTKFQYRTPMGSLLLKIAYFVVAKVILTTWRHYDVMTSFWRHETMSIRFPVKFLLSVPSFKIEL